ncbi:MAG TPA: hypothetical protein VH165_36245 [Kofleriaceae bacterium]|nr:hypothetical protein [Kofleriaceae bacterium]
MLAGLAACSDAVVPDAPDTGSDLGAREDPTMATITVNLGGAATGSVSAQGADLACGDVCTATVPIGTMVTLTASPDVGATFSGWGGGGDCTGSDPDCAFTVARDVTVTAGFDVAMYTLTVGLPGDGSGSVMSMDGSVACPGACTVTVPYNTTISLAASAAGGTTFLGWSGGCTGFDVACTLAITADTAVSAAFVVDNQLVVAKAGNGSGTVTSNPMGISCGTICSQTVSPGAGVTLTAVPDDDSTFTGWSGGGCTGTDTTCTVTVGMSVQVTAEFTINRFTLTVTKTGTGSGTVMSTPGGISCGATCSEAVVLGAVVMLSAVPMANSTFTGWSGGGCSGTGTCVVTANVATQVTAKFTLKQFTLTVTNTGSGGGSGKVTSSPAGISCGATCSHTYNAGTVITLTASPTPGSKFTGWTGGGCSGTGTCKVTINAATAVTAKFALGSYVLSVQLVGSGDGAVTSSPAGINCTGGTCTHTYAGTTVVTLRPSAGADSNFIAWGGACSGAGNCTVTMDSANTVTAQFKLVIVGCRSTQCP